MCLRIIHEHVFSYLYIFVYICVYLYIFIYICIYLYIFVYICIYLYIFVYMFVCICYFHLSSQVAPLGRSISYKSCSADKTNKDTYFNEYQTTKDTQKRNCFRSIYIAASNISKRIVIFWKEKISKAFSVFFTIITLLGNLFTLVWGGKSIC